MNHKERSHIRRLVGWKATRRLRGYKNLRILSCPDLGSVVASFIVDTEDLVSFVLSMKFQKSAIRLFRPRIMAIRFNPTRLTLQECKETMQVLYAFRGREPMEDYNLIPDLTEIICTLAVNSMF